LILANLQFVYGKKVFLEVLSQHKAPDNWQVSVLKTDSVGIRTLVLYESGVGLIHLLQKLHRKSAQMLCKFITDNSADAQEYVMMRKEFEAEVSPVPDDALPQLADLEKTTKVTKKRSKNLRTVDMYALTGMGSDINNPLSDELDYVNQLTRQKAAEMYANSPHWNPLSEFGGYYSPGTTPPANLNPLDNPAEFFSANGIYHADIHEQAMRLAAIQKPRPPMPHVSAAVKQIKVKGPVSPAPATAETAVEAAVRAAVKADVKADVKPDIKSQPEKPAVPHHEPVAVTLQAQVAKRMMSPKQRDTPPRYSVILNIQWSGYGKAVVADECQLSVRAVQSRVRYMLRTHGRELFGDAGSKIPAAAIAPEEVVNINVMIKGMRINDARIFIGPSFGDDLSSMVGPAKPGNSIKIEIDLLWNGEKPPTKPVAIAPATATTADAAN
jgi:hypothetical protein